MSPTLQHPKSGRKVTVADDAADFYKEHGWVIPDAVKAQAKTDTVEIPDGEPVEDWTGKQITAYAERESLDLGGATKKADMIAAIAAAREANKEPSGSDNE